ncbi:hypothetical protein [Bradyrhizobium japonicum]|uniref:hypothetical protein n=1 Tax=Bradyrhizobium japonicum TaxID=375 RepID=UPI001B8A1991|nr:hypothetical protein [Bradyrhizobium japonicum]MBR0971877.1 hypothetical protein [Bradyrhizobium japonicum]
MRAILVFILASLGATDASAENVKVFGIRAGALSATPGAFIPTGTDLACYALQGGQCWDGKRWKALFPAGERKYAKPTAAQVACAIIIEPENDCWTGFEWYHLPSGRLFGMTGGVLSPHPGAFITAPLR